MTRLEWVWEVKTWSSLSGSSVWQSQLWGKIYNSPDLRLFSLLGGGGGVACLGGRDSWAPGAAASCHSWSSPSCHQLSSAADWRQGSAGGRGKQRLGIMPSPVLMPLIQNTPLLKLRYAGKKWKQKPDSLRCLKLLKRLRSEENWLRKEIIMDGIWW